MRIFPVGSRISIFLLFSKFSMKNRGASVKERALDGAWTESPGLTPRDHSKSALTSVLGSCMPRENHISSRGRSRCPSLQTDQMRGEVLALHQSLLLVLSCRQGATSSHPTLPSLFLSSQEGGDTHQGPRDGHVTWRRHPDLTSVRLSTHRCHCHPWSTGQWWWRHPTAQHCLIL